MPLVYVLKPVLQQADEQAREEHVLARLSPFYNPTTREMSGKLVVGAWSWGDERAWPVPAGSWDIAVAGLMRPETVEIWGIIGRARCDHRGLESLTFRELLSPSLLHSLALIESDWPDSMERRQP